LGELRSCTLPEYTVPVEEHGIEAVQAEVTQGSHRRTTRCNDTLSQRELPGDGEGVTDVVGENVGVTDPEGLIRTLAPVEKSMDTTCTKVAGGDK
jgi:hypothetical protein